ncbi:thiol:disulfide interchange protein TlpA [Aquabacter sp. L1I39]|uniref:thiol:disulfide interchange protein TlpA n=1 Tax=Aquabacter sp. L1I39 TaxID=2820278 RepID=UPI001FFC90CD|nr:TlpA disulfide reductase family protein [Aquabacter sp. L1I39]
MTEPTAPHTPDAEAPKKGKAGAVLLVGGAMLAGALVGALALYGMNGLPGNAPLPPAASSASAQAEANAAAPIKDPNCAGAVTLAERLKPYARGEIAALSLAQEPRRIPDLTFANAEGKPMSLRDFEGKLLLVNLWATWCVPCRKEMPALDALQKDLGGDRFEVVAINLDTRDPEKPKAFLKEIGIKSLGFFADSGTKSFQALRAAGRGFGLPTTLLVDANGCEVGFLAGPAEWASEDAQALVKAALQPGS